ncbi:MAG TPA: DUF433 domain-containing protein [Anaerolineae bacterium]|nr:DUF433 domain-containing protein [Anaerolineae bacterium]
MATQILSETENAAQPIETPTEHPHVVWVEDTFRKKLVIRVPRIQIWVIAALYRQGNTVEDIITTYSYLEPAVIFDAISYYLDHTQEIEQEIESNRLENVLAEAHGRIEQDGSIVFDDIKK